MLGSKVGGSAQDNAERCVSISRSVAAKQSYTASTQRPAPIGGSPSWSYASTCWLFVRQKTVSGLKSF